MQNQESVHLWRIWYCQSYEIKSPPRTILWFRILGIFSVENIARLGVFMLRTCTNSQLLRRVLWINAELTTGASFKHKNTQPSYIFKRENPKNSEPQNGLRRGLDFIALQQHTYEFRMWLWCFTEPIEKIITLKNVRAWVSMDFK